MNTSHAENIAETLKMNAYIDVCHDAQAAKDTITSKNLVFGQMACVPFYYPDEDSESRRVLIMMGIGGIDGNVNFFSNYIDSGSDISDAKVYLEENKTFGTLEDQLQWIVDKCRNPVYIVYVNE